MRVVLVNYDKTDVLLVDAVVQTLTLSAKHGFRSTETFISLQTKMREHFASDSLAALRLQSYLLHDATDEHECLDGADLQLTLVGPNVAGSQNFVLVQSFETSDKLVSEATEEAHKKQSHFDEKGAIKPQHVSKHMGHILPVHMQATHAALVAAPPVK